MPGDHGVIVLPAEKTKTHESRVTPITARLNAILKMRQTEPDGEDFPPTTEQTSTYPATTVSKLRATARRFEIARRACTHLAQNDKGAPEPRSETPSETPANALH
jgi:hypothetical protein